MKAFDIKFQIYADNETEVEELRQSVIWFINEHRNAGRAVTATKLSTAIRSWDKNVIVRNRIIDYLKKK